MARQPRIIVAGMPHHVTHRGNRKCTIFHDDADRRNYLRLLREQCVRCATRIWSYALMNNHVHLVAVPTEAESLSIALQNAHGRYAEYFNLRHGTVGHLWGGRFKSSILDEGYLWNAIRYVELNPVRAGIVKKSEDYYWSSAQAHCGLREDALLSNDLLLLEQIPDWPRWLRDEVPIEEMRVLRTRTQTGQPCGTEAFVRRIGEVLGRNLEPQKPGPKKRSGIEGSDPLVSG